VKRIHPSFWALASLLVLFFGLLVIILLDRGPTRIDEVLLVGLEGWRSPTMSRVVGHLTDLGGHHLMIPLCTVLVFGVFWRWRRAGLFLAVSLGGSALLNEGVKELVGRARPTVVSMVEHPRGLSFPSGHSQSTMAFATAFFLLIWFARPRWRGRAALFFLLPLLVGWTRTYLGVHYPTDVLAGWSLSAAWVIVCWTWLRRGDLPPFATECTRGSARSSETEPDDSGSGGDAPPLG